MKKIFGIVFLVFFSVMYISSVNASTEKVLQSGKTYKLDMNGGKAEKVKISFDDGWRKGKNHQKANWKLYVNNKKVSSYSFEGGSDSCIQAYYLDVDVSDKYHEILVISRIVNGISVDVRIIRYYKNNKVKTIKQTQEGFSGEPRSVFYRSCGGNNHISFLADTPFHNNCFGLNYCILDMVVDRNLMSFSNNSTYDLGASPYGGSYEYKLNRSMTLYRDENGLEKKAVVRNGTVFHTLKIRPVSRTASTHWGIWSIYVKIETQSGETGWIYFPASDSNKFLVSVPLWG